MEEHISTSLNLFQKENILDDQVRWEYQKYKLQKFSTKISKAHAKKLRLERDLLGKKNLGIWITVKNLMSLILNLNRFKGKWNKN